MKHREQKTATKRIGRREFLKAAAISGGAMVGGSLLAGCGSQATAGTGGNPSSGLTLDLTKPENQALASVGGSLALDANDLDPQGILLYRSSESAILALSRKCTHLGCAIGGFQNGVSTCPCHGSQYDSGGKVIKGPARDPLKTYTATLSGSTVTVTA
jgi:cytochrome b6-f complex iron-sulfur subunit